MNPMMLDLCHCCYGMDLEAETLPEVADLALHVQTHACLFGPPLLNHGQFPQLELERHVLCAEKVSGIHNRHV